MIGLLALACIAALGWIYWKFINALTKRIASRPLRTAIKVGMVAVLLVAALLDEFVGMHEFHSLCTSRGIESVDLRKAEGRKVEISYGDRQRIAGPILPIWRSEVVYQDATTKERAFSHENYYADGGWLMRYTFLSMGRSGPMLFPGNGCGINERLETLRAHKIEIVSAGVDELFDELQTFDWSQV